MIENNLLKSNFLGRDGFRWWIGQIPPSKTWLLQFLKDRFDEFGPYEDAVVNNSTFVRIGSLIFGKRS